MPKFRKKPVVVEAMQFNGFSGSPDFIDQDLALFLETAVICADKGKLVICTLEGGMEVSEGDWIIKSVKGEFYPCKPDIFDATYEHYEDDSQELFNIGYPSFLVEEE